MSSRAAHAHVLTLRSELGKAQSKVLQARDITEAVANTATGGTRALADALSRARSALEEAIGLLQSTEIPLPAFTADDSEEF